MLPRTRAVALTNYQEVARFVGLDPVEMLRRAEISEASLVDLENWLPASNVLALLDESATQSGRDDFAILMAGSRTLTSLGPVSLLMKHEATVYEVVRAAVDYKHLLSDLLHIRLQEDGESAVLEWHLLPGLHSSNGVNLIASITYRCISDALELQWKPDCIHFRHGVPSCAATFRRYFNCPLEFDSNFDGMSCSTRHLRTPNPFADADLAAYARRLLDLLPGIRHDSTSDKVRSAILLLIDAGQGTADRVAQCLGVQLRTLQRLLSQENTSFSELLNEVRSELAVRLLTSTTQPLAYIAECTGYSTTSAFTRWFTAEFGVPPDAWRRRKRGLGNSRPSSRNGQLMV